MRDPSSLLPALPPTSAPPPRAVLRMISSERMAGSVPAWVTPRGSKEETLSHLENAKERNFDDVLTDALAYTPQEQSARAISEEPFGFGDLIDMVNPLQHIPLVGHLYREITGDQIRPASQIIGGAVFGGFVGAASSLVNVIIEEETGKDIAGNVLALASPDPEDPNAPIERLAAAQSPLSDLPGSALSFVALDHPAVVEKPKMVWKFNE